MFFDRKLLEEQIALNRIHPIQKLAWDALEAGLDGPAIRRLAALEKPSSFEVDVVLPRALQEMDLERITKAEAAERTAIRIARRILESDEDPLTSIRELYSLWSGAVETCSPKMTAFGCLDDEVAVARSLGQSDDEIRQWLRRDLCSLIDDRQP
jgi:hypothetical protein